MFPRKRPDEIPERVLKKFNIKPEPLPKPKLTHVNKLVRTLSIIGAITLIVICCVESGLEWLIGYAYYDAHLWFSYYGEDLIYIIFGLVMGWLVLTGRLDYKKWKEKWDP